ncbi:T9SS type B sorting domain-containing protein [Winogradskyella sp. PC D3.3]
MRNYLFILAFFVFFSVKGQNEANIWYFGFNAGLDFNSGSPVVLLDGALHTNEGCATISDTDGNLLFYTDGVSVYNKDHNVMPNGFDLSGSWSSTHSAIVIPQPNEDDKYYVFTVDVYNEGDTNGLQYSEVDMSLNNGLGDITVIKNTPLEPIVNEKVIAVLNENEDGYWVVSHRHNTDEFIAFEVNSLGVNPIPVVSAVGSPTGFLNIGGQIKISPVGNKLAVARGGEVQLFDFDNGTGIISNPMTLDSTVNSYGVEFSPNGNLLYIAFYGGVYQYDLQQGNESDIISSRITLRNIQNEGFASMQIGPDGKIYIARTERFFLDVIENPNVLGLGCNYVDAGVILLGRESRLGLPTFMQSFFNVGFQVENGCEGDVTEFSSNISQSYDTLIWDFGDGNTSTDENPTHTYANAGAYEVSLSVTAGAENSVDAKTISVYELPVVTPIVELKQCDDDLDGFTSFNLNEANAEISVNHINETITYYESQLDAENESNAILNITDYVNQVVSMDSIWARVENSNGCYAISQINLIVSTTQIQLSFIRDFYQCDDGVDTTDGIATFDLSSVNNEVQDLFPTGQQLTINYYSNLADALAEVNAITDISNYQNIGYPNTQDIFIRVDSTLDNDCLGLGHHITLHVENIPIANAVTIVDKCDDDGDGNFAFDTSTIETTLLNGQTNVTVSYTDGLGNLLSSPLPNPFNTASQTITARVTNATSQDLDGACYDETPIVFTVDAAAVAHQVTDIIVCDDANNDGLVNFDTSTIEATILNGQSGMEVSYFDSYGMALPSPLPNPFTTTTQSITVRVENQLSASCYDETVINFIVSQQPIANPIADDFVCDDVLNDGEHTFTLSDYDAQILNDQSSVTFEVFYFQNEVDAIANIDVLLNSYTVNSTAQTVFARIQNRNNPNCFDITTFQLGVHYLPIAHQPEPLFTCDDESNDGIAVFDLSSQNTAILNGQLDTVNIVTYYVSLEDAENNTNALGVNFTNTQNPQTIYARIENSNLSECYTTTYFQLFVKEQPELLMDDETPICEGNTVQLIADIGYDYYTWSTGQTTRSIMVDAPGNYTVTASNAYGSLICSTEKTISVVISNIARITDIEAVDWTQNANAISVFVEGNGDYEYSIDGFNYQDESIFNGLIIDEYTVYVRDKNGCGIVSESIYLLNYPRFFTPNGDGDNDYWQIKNSVKEPLNKLYIYNRYGKLIIQLRPNDFGWDGTLNGSKLPSSDYWFVLERQNGKTYTGHFALKR